MPIGVYKRTVPAWNKGLTKKDPRVKKYVDKITKKRSKKCVICSKLFLVSPSLERIKFCSRKCYGKYRSKHFLKEKNPIWKGKIIDQDGYVLIYDPNNKMSTKNGYVRENRSNIKITFNRNMIVHHINGIKNDNRMENLLIMTRSEHAKLHHYLRKNMDLSTGNY